MKTRGRHSFFTQFTIWSLLIILGIWFVGPLTFKFSVFPFAGIFGPTDNLENVFSPVSAFLSALATFGTLYVIFQQHQAFERQQFEHVFFNMLAMHQANRDAITIPAHLNPEDKERISSPDAFYFMFQSLSSIYTYATYGNNYTLNKKFFPDPLANLCDNYFTMYRNEDGNITINDKEKYRIISKIFSEYFNNILMQYRIHLYHTLKYVDKHKCNVIDENEYYPIIRAQLSTYELLLLYYYILDSDDIKENCPRGISKFQCYAEKSTLFHCLDQDLLFDNGKAGEYPSAVFEHEPWTCEEPCHKN